VTISVPQTSTAPASAIDARLYKNDQLGRRFPRLALIFLGAGMDNASVAAAISRAVPVPEPSAVGHATAEELGAILDTLPKAL